MIYYSKNKSMHMGDFLKALLARDGKLYKKKNYRKEVPGSKYSYSNAAATLAAYIIELVYEMPYANFTEKHILRPLGMEDSGWSFESIDAKKHTRLYFLNKKVMPKYTLITYPDGGLLTNIKDLSGYLQEQIKGFTGSSDFLSPASYQEMMSPSLSPQQQERSSRNYGVFWERRGPHVGHNGGDPGAVCFLRFNSETGVGKIIMVNMIPNTPLANVAFSAIWGMISDFGDVMGREKNK